MQDLLAELPQYPYYHFVPAMTYEDLVSSTFLYL